MSLFSCSAFFHLLLTSNQLAHSEFGGCDVSAHLCVTEAVLSERGMILKELGERHVTGSACRAVLLGLMTVWIPRPPGCGFNSSLSPCVFSAQTVISEEKGQCYRILGSGQGPSSCSLPILRNITKQICCCSRVGKAWGSDCQRCPYFGSGQSPGK